MSAVEAESPWIEWRGQSDQPDIPAGTLVDVRYNRDDGCIESGEDVGAYFWRHVRGNSRTGRIVAYRVVKP